MSTFLEKLTTDLKRHEGFSQYPYTDTTGNLTIGYGHNLTALGISRHVAKVLFEEDLGRSLQDLDIQVPWWRGLPEDVQLILANMNFNMGWPTLKGFQKMWAALEARNYRLAAHEMRESVWYVQTKTRGKELADRMEALADAQQAQEGG